MRQILKLCRILITFLFFLLKFNITFSQEYFKLSPNINRLSQSKLYYDKPGSYELSAVLDKTDVSKGENLKVDIFITGYGIIESPKMSIYPSSSILNSDSKIYTSLSKINDSLFSWGGNSITFDNLTTILLTGGITLFDGDDSVRYTIFMDVFPVGNSNLIYTETSLSNKGPVSIDLKIKENTDPGEYKIKFYLSYFNGIEWKLSQTHIEFRVNNWVEDNPVLVVVLGLVFAFLALLGNFIKGFKLLFNLLKFPFRKHTKMQVPERQDNKSDSAKKENISTDKIQRKGKR